MEIKTIKGVSEEKWIKLKVLSAKNKISMGKLVEEMIDSYERRKDNVWDEILYGDKILSDKEAREIKKVTRKLRRNKWERNVNI
jgi:hypothetical protein